MERPRARPRNFFNTEPPPSSNNNNAGEEETGERDDNDNHVTPQKRPRREKDRDRDREPQQQRSRHASGRRGNTLDNDSDLDAAELNRRIERLQRDLNRRDRELDEERGENEKAMDKIKKLERDKVELKREVEDFRLEVEEYKKTVDELKSQMRSRSGSYSPAEDPNGNLELLEDGEEGRGHYQKRSSKNYELIISQKNREISQLMEDIERMDEDKTTLQEQLTNLKDNLEEATQQIESMANEHFSLKSTLDKAEDQIRLLQEEKTVLEIKERDLMGFKERHEQYLDNLCKAVDIRVEIWKKMMMEKDEEIARLNSKVETLMSQIPNMQLDSEQATIRHLQGKLTEREDQISQLNDELSRATEEINSNIKMIESLQAKLSASQDVEKTEKLVRSLQARNKKLEEKLQRREEQLKSVEREAEQESSEHAQLLARIHAYESGEYGLSEAISEIKDLKSQIRIRDRQVEQVTQEINILQMQVHDLEDENEMLRDKLGLEKNVDVSRETKRYLRSRKNEILALRKKVSVLEDGAIQLKTMNYSLRKQLALLELNQPGENGGTGMEVVLAERDRPDGGSVTSPTPKPTPGSGVDQNANQGIVVVNFKQEDWKEKYEIILEENTALRKGLQEILDAMHKLTEEGSSEVIIQSPVLEDLLREMSARGIINYPGPITSFHLKMCNLEGKCSQLREDLYRVRQEEKECRAELMEAKAMLKLYEEKIKEQEQEQSEAAEGDSGSVKEVTSREIQTEKGELEFEEVEEDRTEEGEVKGITEEDVSERINREKLRLGEMMEELKQRILDLEKSRRWHEKSEVIPAGRVTPSQLEIHDTLEVARDAIRLLEEKLVEVGLRTEQMKSEDELRIGAELEKTDSQTQTELKLIGMEETIPIKEVESERLMKEKEALSEMMGELKERVKDLETNLKAKDDLITGFSIVKGAMGSDHQSDDHTSAFSDLQEALEVARETIESLQERLKSKDESIAQYRRLLAEVRKEMTCASERHVQEMRQMQLTIHQQQQAFTRMKSTLSQPVKDTLSIEGTIKDQLTRIHELEDEVSQLQHTLANVASQLTAARSDAHRWRCTAEMRLKEAEQAREHFSAETMQEVQSLRKRLKETQGKLEKAEELLEKEKEVHERDSLTDLVSILKKELEQKDKQIEMYLKTLKSTTLNEKSQFETQMTSKEREIDVLKEEISKHLKTIANLQLRLSKTKAINYKTGVTTELEELKLKNRDLLDDKLRLEKEIQEINSKRDEEEGVKLKRAETVARWEESKKWKKSKERLESRVKELEHENERLEKLVAGLKASIHRLEKEKMMLDSRIKSRHSLHAGSSMSKSSLENVSESGTPSAPSTSYQQNYIIAQGEIAKLQIELQDTKELMEKTEFEGREEIEKLKMEIRCLKERIVTQERQLTAYEVAQKGDPEVVQEIQKMAQQETEFQKEVIRLEEENLHLRLQIEQLQLETPRLRDRVQHLQKIVDALKAERHVPGQKPSSLKSHKPLGELERTITALKQVIEKLQQENKRLKSRTDLSGSAGPRAQASERLRASVSALMEEKRALLDRVQSLEQETEKYQRLYMEKSSLVDSFENRLQDAETRAKSSEMRLKAFLDDVSSANKTSPRSQPASSHTYDVLTQKVQKLEEELLHKSKVLSTAKQALREAEKMKQAQVQSQAKASTSKSCTHHQSHVH